MAARFLDDAARAAFQQAIEAIERASSAEIVVAVRRQSSSHLLPNLILGGVGAFLALAYMLFSQHQFSLLSILVDPFVVGVGLGGLAELAPPVKRLLLLGGQRRAAALRSAKATFYDRGVANTRGRTGVLVYLSWLEEQAVVVCDSGVPEGFRGAGVAALERKLTAALGQGGAAVARALAGVAAELGACLPRQADDVNELPDAVDAQLSRRKGAAS